MKKVARIALIVCALIPLITSHGVISPYISGKTLFFRAMIFLVVGITTVLFLRESDFRKDVTERFQMLARQPLFVAVSIFLISVGISTVFAYNRYSAFFSDIVRQEGFITLSALYFFFVALVLFMKKKDWNNFLLISLVSSIVVLGYEFIQAGRGMIRPESFVGNPIFLATYYLFTLYCCGVVYIQNRAHVPNADSWKRYGALALGLLTIVGILLTKSRGVLVGMAVGAFALLIYVLITGGSTTVTRWNIRVKKIAMWLIVLGVVAGGAVFVTRTNTIWTHIPGINRLVATTSLDATTRSRIVNAQVAFSSLSPQKEGWKRIIFGWGQDNFVFMWDKNYTPELFAYDRGILDRAHNKLIDILIMQGIFGIVAYLFVWAFAMRAIFKIKIGRREKGTLLFLLVSYFISNLFAFDVLVTYLFFFFIIAYLSQKLLEVNYEK